MICDTCARRPNCARGIYDKTFEECVMYWEDPNFMPDDTFEAQLAKLHAVNSFEFVRQSMFQMETESLAQKKPNALLSITPESVTMVKDFLGMLFDAAHQKGEENHETD